MADPKIEAKAQQIAKLIDGEASFDTGRVAVSINGMVDGFPATVESLFPGWPFGTSYTMELDIDDEGPRDSVRLSVYPRVGRGLWSFATRLLLFEPSGQSVHDKRLEKQFIFAYDNPDLAERLVRYPGVSELFYQLESVSKFTELVVKTDKGVFLSQPTNFKTLEVDVVRVTFAHLSKLTEIIFESF